MSTCLIVAPCNKGSDIAIDEASHAALLELLKREKHSLYVCGRAYLTNLTKWRDHFQGISDHPLSAERNVVPGTSCLTSAQLGRNATPLSLERTNRRARSRCQLSADPRGAGRLVPAKYPPGYQLELRKQAFHRIQLPLRRQKNHERGSLT